VASYWLVDPDPEQPTLTAFDLAEGCYVETSRVSGTQPFTATRPFAVTVRPDELLADLRP